MNNKHRPNQANFQSERIGKPLYDHQSGNPNPDAVPLNNNRECEPSRFLFNTSPGTYDTIRLTSRGVEDVDLYDLDSWQVGRGTTYGQLAGGEIPPLRKVLHLNADGQEVERGQHVTTMGIEFRPKAANGQDITVLTIPSAPSLYYGDPTRPLSPTDVDGFMDKTRDIVAGYIRANLDTFAVSRLDSSTVFSVSEPVAAYIGLLNAITGAKQRRTNKKLYEGQTVQFFNKSQAVGFYDKGAKEDHFVLPSLDNEDPVNLLRFEVQKKNRRSVTSVYGKLCFLDLGAEAIQAKAIQERGKQFELFFPFNDSDQYKEYSNQYNLFRLMKEEGKRNHVNNFMKALALREGLITIEQVDLFMRLEGYSPQYIRRHSQSLREIQATWVDTKDLYEEVRTLIGNDLKAVA